MQTIKVLAAQCLVDVAIQEAGTVEALFDIANVNLLSITDDLISGTEYVKPDVIEKDIVKLFAALKPASGISQLIRPGGIGFMQIGNDFIVS